MSYSLQLRNANLRGRHGENVVMIIVSDFITGHCTSSTCSNGGVCIERYKGYQCNCASGYMGKNCQYNVNECASGPCRNNGTCHDKVNQYSCTCLSGYTGRRCEADIDDCVGITCEHGGTCRDNVANYTCLCKTGYLGRKCADGKLLEVLLFT